MSRAERWILATGLVIGFAVACGTTDSVIVATVFEGDSLQVGRTDSIVTSIDSITPADTTVVTRLDTLLISRDTVVVQRIDTIVSGTDTVFNVVYDSIIQFDTVVVITVDTVIRYDTVFVSDTVVLGPETLTFNQTGLTVNVGSASTLSVTLYNPLGLPVPTGTVTWLSDNTGIAQVNGSGTVTGVSVGTANIYAFAQSGTSARIAIQVVSPAPPPPVPTGSFRRNLPAGWVTVTDYGFDDALLGHQDGVTRVTRLGNGWDVTDWGLTGGAVRRITDGTAPYSPSYVLEEVYPAGLSGQGPDKVAFDSIPNATKIYISWIVKWDPTFHHNTTSEKLIFFNVGGGGYSALFQFEYGVEMMHGIAEAGGYPQLRANLLPPNQFGHGNAPPVNGVWMEYEILFDQSTGTVKWWKDGVPHGSHTGRAVPTVQNVEIAATWGGGGSKQGVSSRYQDHILIARGP